MFNPVPFPSSRLRRTAVLIVGCGDVGLRVARQLLPRCRVLALTSQPERTAALRSAGLVPLGGDLDDAATLSRLAGLARRVVHLAPPPGQGEADPRTTHLLRALSLRGRLRSLVYGSTTGVYGDAQGARVAETRALAPATARARRRVDAETQLRTWGRRQAIGQGCRVSILRIPGIYAPDREGGRPQDRVLKRSALLCAQDDIYTNHIHADDLARACVAALWRGRPGRVVHASDDTDLPMGDHFDQVADLCGLPRAPRISRAEAMQCFSPLQMSFLSESRRLDNQRLKRELRVVLRHPTVRDGLRNGGLAASSCPHPGGVERLGDAPAQ